MILNPTDFLLRVTALVLNVQVHHSLLYASDFAFMYSCIAFIVLTVEVVLQMCCVDWLHVISEIVISIRYCSPESASGGCKMAIFSINHKHLFCRNGFQKPSEFLTSLFKPCLWKSLNSACWDCDFSHFFIWIQDTEK